MKNKLIRLTAAIVAVAGMAMADFYVVGSLQDENGSSSDWNPTEGLLMAQSGSIYTYTASGLGNGAFYEYKVLDDGGTPPAAWGDPEAVNANTMAYGDADGSVLITVDSSQVNGGGGNVTWVETDGAPLQVVGDFMVAAGGAGDWNPADPAFAMTAQGSGYYSINLVISTAGNYQFKATDGGGWGYQVGPDGFGANAGTHAFTTTASNEAVTLFVDTANQTIGVIPEPATMGLVGVFGAGLFFARRKLQL